MPKARPLNKAINDTFIAPRCEQALDILFEDEDILLINKPSGLLSLSGKNPLNWDSVHYRLTHGQAGKSPAFPNAKLPHRLDFGTSGIMVAGLHAQASKDLNRQFQSGGITKHYEAILAGSLDEDSGQISAPIAKDAEHFPRVKICHDSGKSALSYYDVIERLSQPKRSRVHFTPITGRTHQLRIHSQFIGHPIVGCDLYSLDNSEQMASRLCLHASELIFRHPTTKQWVHAKCPCTF